MMGRAICEVIGDGCFGLQGAGEEGLVHAVAGEVRFAVPLQAMLHQRSGGGEDDVHAFAELFFGLGDARAST